MCETGKGVNKFLHHTFAVSRIVVHWSVKCIGVRANIHFGGQTEFCPNGFSGGGVVAEIFRDPYSVGGGGSSRNFPGSIFCEVAEFFPLIAVTGPKFVFFSR